MSGFDWAAYEKDQAKERALRILRPNLRQPQAADWVVNIVLDDIWKAAQDSYAREMCENTERSIRA